MCAFANTDGGTIYLGVTDRRQVKVIFRRRKLKREKKDVRGDIVSFLKSHEFITRTQIETIAGVSSTSSKYLIRDLIKDGLIEKIGSGPATRYRKK